MDMNTIFILSLKIMFAKGHYDIPNNYIIYLVQYSTLLGFYCWQIQYQNIYLVVSFSLINQGIE
jgi:hypothetical protein